MKTSLFIATPSMPSVSYVYLLTESIDTNVRKAKDFGFHAVEVLLGDPDSREEANELESALAAHSMEISAFNTGRLVAQHGLSLVHPDAPVRDSALDKMKSFIRLSGRFGTQLGIGLARGRCIPEKPVRYSKDLLVEILRELAADAERHGVLINLEPTNRFETDFINTLDEGLEIVEKVGSGNLGLLLDLFHIYIEEKNEYEALVRGKDRLRHIHFSDSDRWPAGMGHGVFDFPRIIALLGAIGYEGYLSAGLVRREDHENCARTTASYLKDLVTKYDMSEKILKAGRGQQ